MWSSKAKQRFKGKGVAGSEDYAEQVRGEVGRGRFNGARDVGPRLSDASRRFLESLGEPVPVAASGANHGPVRRLSDMTEAEKAALRKQYEKGPKR